MNSLSRPLRLLAVFFITVIIPGHAAMAASAPSVTQSCTEVEVNGYRAVPYSCLGQAMTPPAQPAGTNPALATSDISKQQPNNIGQFSQAALHNRMGNTFGKSVFPQRPPVAVTGVRP